MWDVKNINPRVLGTCSNGKAMILLKCATCGSKKPRFITNQEAKGLLSILGLRAPLSKVPTLVDILFWIHKMNEIVNKFLLHLKQPGFTYSACGPFTKSKNINQKFKETGDTKD